MPNTCCSRQGHCCISAQPARVQPPFCFPIPQCWLVAVITLCLFTRVYKLQPWHRGGDRHRVWWHQTWHVASLPGAGCTSDTAVKASSSRYQVPVTEADPQFVLFCVPDSYSWGIFTIQNQKYCHKVWTTSSLFCLRGNTVSGGYFPTCNNFINIY